MVYILPYFTRIIAGVSVPNTGIINASIALARAELPDHGFNHVMRSWLSGQTLINHLPETNRSEIDAEAFGVAALFHDMGWGNNSEIVSNDKMFAIDGANAARRFLQEQGGSTWDKHRIQLVWDAVALHTSAQIFPHKQHEVAYTAAGIATELLGIELGQKALSPFINVTVTQAEADAIIAEYPKQPGLKKYYEGINIGFCISKPQTTYDNQQGDFGEKYVKGYTKVGTRIIDMLDIVFPENSTAS